MILGVPDGFAHRLDGGALLFRQGNLTVGMGTDCVQGIGQFRIFLHGLHEVHLRIAPVAEAVQFHVAEAALVHGLAQMLGKVGVPALLVVTAQGIQFQSVHLP